MFVWFLVGVTIALLMVLVFASFASGYASPGIDRGSNRGRVVLGVLFVAGGLATVFLGWIGPILWDSLHGASQPEAVSTKAPTVVPSVVAPSIAHTPTQAVTPDPRREYSIVWDDPHILMGATRGEDPDSICIIAYVDSGYIPIGKYVLMEDITKDIENLSTALPQLEAGISYEYDYGFRCSQCFGPSTLNEKQRNFIFQVSDGVTTTGQIVEIGVHVNLPGYEEYESRYLNGEWDAARSLMVDD